MGFQTPITISKALEAIEGRQYVLPAIQREFVWRPEQIQCLFDSLMRGYPMGSFLFWIVERESIAKYKFYDFMLHYHEKDNPHCDSIGVPTRDEVTAVLDGQQRLTALNIGLRGSYAYKLPRLRWNNPASFPKRKLCLNLLADAEENEQNMRYDFRFLTNEESQRRDDKHCWYPVGEILQVEHWQDLNDILVDRQLGNRRRPGNVLGKLQKVVHTDQIIAHYKEDDQNIDRVLDIFIRTNSGGTTLSYSDMLMSIATAQWERLDAREAIHGTVDEINRIGSGFAFTQDFLLKSGLMLAGVRNVRFMVTNFNRNNMKLLEEKWDRITSAVRTAVELVARFGFSQASLSANYAVLPIAHYLYCRDNIPTGFLSQSQYRQDRDDIRDWLLRSLVKRGIWGSGLDTLLTSLRNVIHTHGAKSFPSAQLETEMRTHGKSLTFEEEEIDDLVESKDRTFPLLRVLYPFVDVQSNRFHIDHIFPKSRFTRARLLSAGVDELYIPEFLDRVNRLPNLQLLTGEVNESKRDRLPHEWIADTFDSDQASDFVTRYHLGEIPTEITGFNEFYEARRDLLHHKLRGLLGKNSGKQGTSTA